jgi:hypothetical protein
MRVVADPARGLAMDRDENRYWPFDVLPPEQQTEQHRREIQFLETAHRQGYKPYTFGSENFGVTCGERGGVIVLRGRRRWEAIVGTAEETSLSAYLDEFSYAAEAVLLWLRGVDAADVVEQVRGHLVATPGFMLHNPR